MRRRLALLLLGLAGLALVGPQAAAATAVSARYQLRGHLPELGDRPTTRVFQTQAAYDQYRSSLGEANVFPPASSLFMSFETDILALYTRGNDTGGRCIATAVAAGLDGNTVTANLQWQAGTCGAPISAHFPFVLMSISRTASDGAAWVQPARSVCAVVDSADARACASLGGSASPSPTAAASPSPTSTATSPTPTSTSIATASASPTPTRTPTPTPSPVAATASPTSPRPAAAAASPVEAAPPAGGTGSGNDLFIAGALVAVGLVLGIALMAARRPPSPPGFRRR